MVGFLLRRAAFGLVAVLAAASLAFVLAWHAPGGPAVGLAGEHGAPGYLEEVNARLGLDRPAWHVWLDWMGRLLRGDLGTSWREGVPVAALVAERLPLTLSLTFGAAALAAAAGTLIGLAAAAHETRSWPAAALAALHAVPGYVAAQALVAVFALGLGVLPVQGIADARDPAAGGLALLAERARHLALPVLALALPAAGLVVRVFALQHDCGHGSLFRSRRANDAVGRFCSLFTLTPYGHWRRQHAGHHAVWNDLDRRDRGTDIYSTCATVAEYRAMGRWRRLGHRAARHPLVAQLLLPPLVFLVLYRIPFDAPPAWERERRGVHLTNLALAACYGGLCVLLGVGPVASVLLAVMVPASVAGVWLFSVQHRFEGVRWSRHAEWDPVTASLEGSSFLRLPRVLRWFTASLGFHHVHHLAPRVPNHRLEDCHDAHPAFATARVLTLRDALAAPRHALWDEEAGRMVTLKQAEEALPDDGLDGSRGGPGLLSRSAAWAEASLAGRLRARATPPCPTHRQL